MIIKSGIYKIVNLINQKIYIGSAVDLSKRRRDHLNALKNGNHANSKLKNSYNKYGKDNFSFEIIEYIENKENLISREQHYIDTLKPEFNICPTAGNWLGNKHSEETKRKMSLSQLKNSNLAGKRLSEFRRNNDPWNKGLKMNDDIKIKLSIHFSKPVIQIDPKTGEIIKEWPSIKEAQKTLKITHISEICNGSKIRRLSGGFKWKYKEEKIWD